MKGNPQNIKKSVVAALTSQGRPLEGSLTHLSRHQAVFEVPDSQLGVRVSEALTDFKVILNDQALYSGRAMITSLINTGLASICEVSLDDAWLDASLGLSSCRNGQLAASFNEFLREWRKQYTILPEMKVAVADLQSLLMDLRLWLDQLELRITSSPPNGRLEKENETLQELDRPITQAIDTIHGRYEEIASSVPESAWPAHVHFTRRQLHPLFLCAPFAHRSYYKPLGYAGDYEMVNMILRDPHEGDSLFAKAMNVWLLSQPLSEAHRNRIRYLEEKLVSESLRLRAISKPLRVLNLGCGPAHEIQTFLQAGELCNNAEFTLVDFNEETIERVRGLLNVLKSQYGRTTRFEFQKRSVINLLKDAVRSEVDPSTGRYDLVYCAGLFDYLPDRTCKQLMTLLYPWLAPGGLVVATNVHEYVPFRMMECLLDWHLLYRTPSQFLALVPDQAEPEQCLAQTEMTGANVFLEIRKPGGA